MIRISFGKEKGKTWKKPYPKCLSHKILLRYYRGVSNLSQKWQNKHLKKQELVGIFGMIIMEGPTIGMGTKWSMLMKINWKQKNGYGRRYSNGNKNQQRRAHGVSATQTQTHYTTPKGRVSYGNAPSRRIGDGQGDGNGNGEDKNDKNRKRYRDTKYDFEEKDGEESDTEDSFEFEITPQQLSQVAPGGGVLKLTLTRKGPLKITTAAQNKRPDPSQTTVKTVYDPTKEKGPLQRGENVEVKTTPRRGEGFEDQRIKPRKAPNDKRNESFPEDGGPVRKTNPGSGGNSDGNGEPDKGRKPPRKEEGPPSGFRRINGGGGGSDPSEDDGGGGGSTPSSSENTPPTRRKHRRPKFVYVLQGPPGPPGQVGQPGQQVEMEGMARHPN